MRQGGTQVWTGDLSICSRMLYHWAIPPDGKGHKCFPGEFFPQSLPQKWIFFQNSLVQKQKPRQGAPGFEPGTSRSAVECSTPELHPLVKTVKGRVFHLKQAKVDFIGIYLQYFSGTAGVVVSCKIAILATRVRFPGSAVILANENLSKYVI